MIDYIHDHEEQKDNMYNAYIRGDLDNSLKEIHNLNSVYFDHIEAQLYNEQFLRSEPLQIAPIKHLETGLYAQPLRNETYERVVKIMENIDEAQVRFYQGKGGNRLLTIVTRAFCEEQYQELYIPPAVIKTIVDIIISFKYLLFSCSKIYLMPITTIRPYSQYSCVVEEGDPNNVVL